MKYFSFIFTWAQTYDCRRELNQKGPAVDITFMSSEHDPVRLKGIFRLLRARMIYFQSSVVVVFFST